MRNRTMKMRQEGESERMVKGKEKGGRGREVEVWKKGEGR